MKIELNRDEQARVDRVAELEQHRRDGTRYVDDYELNEAKKVAEMARTNAKLRAERLAELDAQYKAQAAATASAQQARVEAEIDAYKRQARAVFPGTAAQFEASWPKILEAWQMQQSLDALGAAHASTRSIIRGAF